MRQLLRWPLNSFVCLAGLFFLTAGAVFAQTPGLTPTPLNVNAGSVRLGDATIVDATRSVIYTMAPDGLEAVSIDSGEVLWSSDVAAIPLAVMGDTLVAQTEPSRVGELALLMLDRSSGSKLRSASAVLPEGIYAGLTDGPRLSFRASATRTSSDSMKISWSSTQLKKEQKLQGYVPAASEAAAPNSSISDNNKATVREVGTALTARPFETRAGGLTFNLSTGRAKALAANKASGLSLAGSGLHTTDILGGVSGRQFLSADGRHVLVSELISPMEGYRWSIYTRAGESLGHIEDRFSVAPFVVSGNSLVFEARGRHIRSEDGQFTEKPQAVQVVDLASGTVLLSKMVSVLDYDGELPP